MTSRENAGPPASGSLHSEPLSDGDWEIVQARMPIACVDLVPVRRNQLGTITHVGLIKRTSPFEGRELWCQVGGRVRRSELLTEAADRHCRDALGVPAFTEFDPAVDYAMQWFPDDRGPDWGWDPRKHAVSACYLVDLPGTPAAQPGGEALEFSWFPVPDGLPSQAESWPGIHLLVDRLLRSRPTDNSAAYQSLSDRALSHDEMTWQAPSLAFAGQAFLLSAALAADTPTGGRILASALSVLISIMSVQLMAKHSALERHDRRMLDDLDRELGYPLVHARPPRMAGLAGFPSRLVWQWGCGIIGLASLLILVSAVTGLGWFE